MSTRDNPERFDRESGGLVTRKFRKVLVEPGEPRVFGKRLPASTLVVENHGPGPISVQSADKDAIVLPGGAKFLEIRGYVSVAVIGFKSAMVELSLEPPKATSVLVAPHIALDRGRDQRLDYDALPRDGLFAVVFVDHRNGLMIVTPSTSRPWLISSEYNSLHPSARAAATMAASQ
jgi:hypothetical protein